MNKRSGEHRREGDRCRKKAKTVWNNSFVRVGAIICVLCEESKNCNCRVRVVVFGCESGPHTRTRADKYGGECVLRCVVLVLEVLTCAKENKSKAVTSGRLKGCESEWRG